MREVFDVSGYGRALLLFGVLMSLLVGVAVFAWLDFTRTLGPPAHPAPATGRAAPRPPQCPCCPGTEDPVHSSK